MADLLLLLFQAMIASTLIGVAYICVIVLSIWISYKLFLFLFGLGKTSNIDKIAKILRAR